MSNPNRTAYTGPPINGPGIMWVNSMPKPPLDNEIFNKWYQDVHIPEIIKAKPRAQGCVGAWRFKCKDPSRRRQYLALYSVPEMSFIQSPEFGRIRQYHEMLPEGGPSQKFVDFDTRFYRRVDVFEKAERTGGIAKMLLSSAVRPMLGREDQYCLWDSRERLDHISQMPGWRKSTRYELIFKVQSKDDPAQEQAPKHLTLHEFEDESMDERMKVGYLRDQMGELAERIDEDVFEFMWDMGEDDVGL